MTRCLEVLTLIVPQIMWFQVALGTSETLAVVAYPCGSQLLTASAIA